MDRTGKVTELAVTGRRSAAVATVPSRRRRIQAAGPQNHLDGPVACRRRSRAGIKSDCGCRMQQNRSVWIRVRVRVANRDVPWWTDPRGNYGINLLGVVEAVPAET